MYKISRLGSLLWRREWQSFTLNPSSINISSLKIFNRYLLQVQAIQSNSQTARFKQYSVIHREPISMGEIWLSFFFFFFSNQLSLAPGLSPYWRVFSLWLCGCSLKKVLPHPSLVPSFFCLSSCFFTSSSPQSSLPGLPAEIHLCFTVKSKN